MTPASAPVHVKSLVFYSTAAQVIPLLFIVMAFEIRFFRGHRRWQQALTVPVGFAALMAELVALRVLYIERAQPVAAAIVWTGLGLMGTLIFALLFAGEQGDRTEKE